MTAPDPLDQPARAALLGAHAHLAVRAGRVLRYRPDVAPFVTLPAEPEPGDWADLATLAGPGSVVALSGLTAEPPDGWDVVSRGDGVQMLGDRVTGAPDPEAVPLGPSDVPEMLDLVARTRPGPFGPATVEMGSYLGLRRDGVLVAMAGERLRPPGRTEISAVCTDAAFRGQGLGTRLVLAVADGVRRRGDVPFLHAAAVNTTAIRLYEELGFRLRRTTTFLGVRVPVPAPA